MKKRFYACIAGAAVLIVFWIVLLILMMRQDGGFDAREPLYYAGFGCIAGCIAAVVIFCRRLRMLNDAADVSEPDFWFLRDRQEHPLRYRFWIAAVLLLTALCIVLTVSILRNRSCCGADEPLYYALFCCIAMCALTVVIGLNKRR